MSLIITATDFSAVAEDAIHYSCNLALSREAKVVILHSYVFPIMFSDITFPATLMDETQRDAEIKMATLVDDMRAQYLSLDISGFVKYGNIIDVIDEYSEKNTSPWLVIVGNSNSFEYSAWFDSTLHEAGIDLIYPLLAIPPGFTFKPVRNIGYAFDNNVKGQTAALMQIKEFADGLNTELHVFYAQRDGLSRETVVDVDPSVKNILSGAGTHFHFEYGVDIDNAILAFAQKNNVDWLALMPRKHSFFEGLFHNSHTKAIAQKTNIPFLLLHEENTK